MRALACLLALGVATAAPGCHAPGGPARLESPDREWWFPCTAPAGTVLHYHVEYFSDWVQGTDTQHRQSAGDFALEFAQEPGKPGVAVRMAEGASGREGDATRWLHWLYLLNREGVRITEDGVWLQDAPLLLGPWRSGERMTFSGLVWFLQLALHVVHVQVRSATPDHVALSFELWMGDPLPHSRGSGAALLQSDARGVTSLSLSWNLVTGSARLDSEIRLTRE